MSNKDKLMADLGKASKLLESARSLPQCRACSELVSEAHRAVRIAIKDLKANHRSEAVRKIVSGVLQLLNLVSTLLKLLELKDRINFCKERAFA